RGFQLQPGAALLKPASSVTPALRLQTVSAAAVQTLRLSIPYTLFCRTIEELADRDPVTFDLCAFAGIHDPVLYHVGLRLKQELETPSSTSLLYAQSAAHLLTVHLLHTYATRQVVIQERQDSFSPRQSRQITDYIQTYLTQSLSLEELAQQIGFSPYHFARLFRQAFGESPHQFVIRQRVEYAKRLLTDPELPLAQVALESGFADQSHLTQTFKRHTGLTPRAFRQNR
ncbi:MAG: helix-turn-helix transcriptional regulator, partial [Anaerolineae bacterium]|nr:helix-turn-helix transcriptional regulator [Anaerolineae bacterium]